MFVMLGLSDPATSFSHSVSSAGEYLLHAFFAAGYPGQDSPICKPHDLVSARFYVECWV
jgi:hypothetical protein